MGGKNKVEGPGWKSLRPFLDTQAFGVLVHELVHAGVFLTHPHTDFFDHDVDNLPTKTYGPARNGAPAKVEHLFEMTNLKARNDVVTEDMSWIQAFRQNFAALEAEKHTVFKTEKPQLLTLFDTAIKYGKGVPGRYTDYA